MLEVVIKNEKVVDERWESGLVRMSKEGDVVILVSYDTETAVNRAVVLQEIGCQTPYISEISEYDKYYWLDRCPNIVENVKLIIGGGNDE